MTTNSELFKAILAMDSYNREYSEFQLTCDSPMMFQ